jgi:hypothetical protein
MEKRVPGIMSNEFSDELNRVGVRYKNNDVIIPVRYRRSKKGWRIQKIGKQPMTEKVLRNRLRFAEAAMNRKGKV